MIKIKKLVPALLLIALFSAAYLLFPWLFKQVVVWQHDFNQIISSQLHQIKQTPTESGMMLILVSFLYGVFHAVGPGHGKFVIASYLSTHESKLKTSMRLTFLSSLMQGVVAVTATSIIVVALHLSSSYFKASQLWLERAAFVLMMLLGVQWILQAVKAALKAKRLKAMAKPKPQIRRLSFAPGGNQSAVRNAELLPEHPAGCGCGCGHQHLPDSQQLQAQSWKSQLLVIFSIGMRPCTGAIFVLFLAFMLDLYPWGVAAAMAMAFGTGLMLSGFAIIVQYARQTAVQMGAWYGSLKWLSGNGQALFKLTAGILVIAFAATLFIATLQPSTGGAVLFGR